MAEETEAEFFDLLVYLVSCARVAVDEPKRYGSFRLFEASTKLVKLGQRLGFKGKIYRELLKEIESNRDAAASSSKVGTKEYLALLDRMIDLMVEEVKV